MKEWAIFYYGTSVFKRTPHWSWDGCRIQSFDFLKWLFVCALQSTRTRHNTSIEVMALRNGRVTKVLRLNRNPETNKWERA